MPHVEEIWASIDDWSCICQFNSEHGCIVDFKVFVQPVTEMQSESGYHCCHFHGGMETLPSLFLAVSVTEKDFPDANVFIQCKNIINLDKN